MGLGRLIGIGALGGDFYNAVTAIISGLGYAYWKPAKGSHEKWRHAQTGKMLVVPRNLKSRHTANGILKSAGSDKRL
ncbi:MAG: type II toxin-antitoxin system HicA family toxin [Roseitalea porphyridii]|uniref:type II toxin-antitoxin system HicA family toxin n=1 Tax=Roseitalea porphyridii TaxID=1852022 RepID=UPI0032D986CB